MDEKTHRLSSRRLCSNRIGEREIKDSDINSASVTVGGIRRQQVILARIWQKANSHEEGSASLLRGETESERVLVDDFRRVVLGRTGDRRSQ